MNTAHKQATQAHDRLPEPFVRAPRPAVLQVILLTLAGLICAGFIALGVWQLERRVWKLDLIERVEQRIHAQATDFPPPSLWPRISAATDEYRRVRASGNFLYGQETLVQASTELGSGLWVMTPLRLAGGGTVLVNRGFVPTAGRPRASAHNDNDNDNANASAAATVTVTGLVRMTQPGGGFLRHNDPVANQWFSRDVQAIATARKLQNVAPVFIDADAAVAENGNSTGDTVTIPGGKNTSAVSAAPVGGLTVIAFPNNHLVYALTWFALALMTAAAGWFLIRTGRRLPGPRSEYTAR